LRGTCEQAQQLQEGRDERVIEIHQYIHGIIRPAGIFDRVVIGSRSTVPRIAISIGGGSGLTLIHPINPMDRITVGIEQRTAGADRDLQIARHSLRGCAGCRTAVLLIHVPVGCQYASQIVPGFIMDGGQAGVILQCFIIRCAGGSISNDGRVDQIGRAHV
jgi:hypothetical protein